MYEILIRDDCKYKYGNLTQNGNEYKPSRLGVNIGAAAGLGAGLYAAFGDTFIKNANSKLLEASKNSKGFLNTAKNMSKFAGAAALTGIGISVLAAIGGALGNTFIDAGINKERRAQADGEAALREKFLQGYLPLNA